VKQRDILGTQHHLGPSVAKVQLHDDSAMPSDGRAHRAQDLGELVGLDAAGAKEPLGPASLEVAAV
jgi:hypothetical protein